MERDSTSRRSTRWSNLPPRRLLLRRAIAFAGAAGLLAYLAFDGGGYGLVVRQQVALAVWLVIALGFAFGLLPRARLGKAALVPALALLGLVIWLAISLTWTESEERTSAELARLLGYAGLVALILTSLNRHTFRAAAAGATAAALVVSGIALASRLYPDAFPGATGVARHFRIDRLDYPLDYWNAVGAWGAMAIVAGLAWSAHARTHLARALSLSAVPIAGTAVYVTYSRGGVVGSAAAIIAALALSRNRWTVLVHALAAGGVTAAAILIVRDHQQIADATGGAGGGDVAAVLVAGALLCAGVAIATRALGADRLRLPREAAAWAVPAFVVLLVAAAVIAAHGPISRGWHEFRTAEQPASGPDPAARLTSAGGNRNDLWSSALHGFDAHPVGGTGAGTFEFWWSRDARDREYVRDAHSLYLEALTELGLPGLLLLLGFLGGMLYLALRARSGLTEGDLGAGIAMTGVFAVFLVNAGVDWMWEETAVAALGLGGVAIAAAGGSGRLRSARRRGPIGAPGVRVAIVVAALAVAAVEVPAIVATQRVHDSQDAAREHDLANAAALAQDAVDAEPWAATPHLQLALVLEAQGRLRRAESEAGRAAAKESTNWIYPLVLARIELQRGERKDARKTFDRGRRLRPLSPEYSPLSPLGRRLYTVAELRRIYAPRDRGEGR